MSLVLEHLPGSPEYWVEYADDSLASALAAGDSVGEALYGYFRCRQLIDQLPHPIGSFDDELLARTMEGIAKCTGKLTGSAGAS